VSAGTAIAPWQRVLEEHTYARARVRLAELCLTAGKPELTKSERTEALADDVPAPAFQRWRERVWVKRARSLLRELGEGPVSAPPSPHEPG